MVQQFFKRKFPYGFLVIICIIIIFLYIMFAHILLIDIHPWSQPLTIIFLIFYHLIFILLIWSIIQSIKTDPGKVPAQWGFQIDNRQKKYCLICHVFKPDRTHHCSTCNRCVLNMDHHCPWINSCIGFYNRKAFILMLFYTTVMTFLNILIGLLSIYPLTQKSQQEQERIIVKIVFIAIAFILNLIIFIAILNFLYFHLNLIFSNYTTLQILELKRQRKDEDQTPSKYNIGNYYNWVQVFGRNWVIWSIPIFLSDDGPSGDGVLWPVSNDQNQMKD